MAGGFRVLPDERIPDNYGEAIVFIDDRLSRCAASIHLLGERSGYIPSARTGEPLKPITRLQLERAEARCDADPSFRRFIWARQHLKPRQDDEQDLLAALKNGTTLRETDEFVTEPLELFKNAVLDHLRARRSRTARDKPKNPCPILLISRPANKAVAADLATALYGAQYEVFSLSLEGHVPENEKRITQLGAQVDGAIVVCAPADATWAQMVLGALYRISTARDDRRWTVRAILFLDDAGEAPTAFCSHYCNLVLTGKPNSWDGALKDLRAKLEQATPP
jgi:hypothetical protein